MITIMIASTSRRCLFMVGSPCCGSVPLRIHLASVKRDAQNQSRNRSALPRRHFSQSVYSSFPRKDSQDKDSINTEASEYSKSATDDEGARQNDAAFDPSITDPQEQKDKAGEGTGEGTVSNRLLLSSFRIKDAAQPALPADTTRSE